MFACRYVALLSLLLIAPAWAFEGIAPQDRTILVREVNSGQQWQWNSARAPSRYSPCSTFKIPNALIGLETGTISLARNERGYSFINDPSQPWWPQNWAGRQDLRGALRNSTVWYFQALARGIGLGNYGRWLQRFGYGNQNTSGGVDHFWLGDSLRISAVEQMQFLDRLQHGKLGVRNEYVDAITDALVIERGDNWRWWGKTGLCLGHDGRHLGWIVGAVEKPEGTWLYALNASANDFDQLRVSRVELARQALREAGAL
jgi:beta-lactamase class D